jgi:hypothetical protein
MTGHRGAIGNSSRPLRSRHAGSSSLFDSRGYNWQVSQPPAAVGPLENQMIGSKVHPWQAPARFRDGARFLRWAAWAPCVLLLAEPLAAQDLDPRSYAHAPVNATFLVTGFSLSRGGVVTDPTLPVTDINATAETPVLGLAHSFGLFGKTAQAFAGLPYSWAQVSGKVQEETTSITRSGLSDMRLRLSVLLRGAPASTAAELIKRPRSTIVGVSVTASAPTGQFFPDRLINLGTHRWAFKPEFAVSHPIGAKWLFDAYAGVWLFTANDSFYPGTARRTQALMGTFQAHISYNFTRLAWAAFDATYYVGGQTTVSGVGKDDRQSNARLGGTMVFPVGKRHSIKVAVSRGAIIRIGANFTTVSIGWQTGWIRTGAPAKALR